ncbi:uncharacterized protein LOC124897941 [Capsicum annuum]|uniref:uncharacterized protein LOC124897941 n=1 Tax=Capsicum annuum TaxID=4072 RepID=UPI001FB13856|nr:uncharacterized protein LOC124897941 [Capsicum annuum]
MTFKKVNSQSTAFKAANSKFSAEVESIIGVNFGSFGAVTRSKARMPRQQTRQVLFEPTPIFESSTPKGARSRESASEEESNVVETIKKTLTLLEHSAFLEAQESGLIEEKDQILIHEYVRIFKNSCEQLNLNQPSWHRRRRQIMNPPLPAAIAEAPVTFDIADQSQQARDKWYQSCTLNMAYDGDEEVHGGDNLGKTKTKKRDKSRNKDEAQIPVSEAITNVENGEGSASGSLDERIVSTEAGLAVLGHRFKTIESNVGTLEVAALEGLDEVKADLSEQNEEHKEGMTSLELNLTKALSALHEEFGSKLSEVMLGQSALQEEVADLKQQLEAARVGGNHGSVAYHDACIEAPKPNVFKGERNAQDVENFIWQLESYFEHVKIVDGAARIRITTMYFSDVAMLWWCRKKVDMERGLCTIADWDQFKDELKEQFYPQNVVDEARRKLRKLKQTSSIHNYVREFTKLSLLVTSFSSEFLDGLQNWAKQELRRRNVKTVDEAIKVEESLIDFHADYAKAKDSRNKPVAAKGDHGDKGKDKFIPNKNHEFKGERNQPSSFRKNYEEKKKGVANHDSGCYLCGDTSHFARSCPSLSKMGAMIAATRKDQASTQAGSFEEQEAQAANPEKGKGHAVGLFNHMALFNHMTLAALAAKKHNVRARESLFVDGEVNGRAVCIMVDTGATHNFVTEEKAKELGLAFVTSGSMLKTVNCLPTNVNSLAPRVSLTLGGWKGETDFSVVPMDIFDIVLGLDFWYEINAFISPRLNQLAICDMGGSCIVPLIRVAQSGTRLSAMQLVKGFKKREPTFLAALMEIVDCQEAELVPSYVQRVLEENKDVMLEELPKRLPPRSKVDHEIELVPGAKPPAMTPYQMSPSELEELRKQLKELLKSDHIRPSKAPFRAPVLFQKKKGGTLRLCIDYHALNKVTVKNKYLIPLIADLFDRLGQAKVFTKMDLRKGYYQVRIAEGDEAKMTCVTRYGSYEWMVMPFGLTNAPVTFFTLMNRIFQPYLDQFLVIYLDDIVVYSSSMEKHVRHLQLVFNVLRENELCVKREKCTIAQPKVQFLGHTISQGQIQMDSDKVEAIRDWEVPTKVPKLRSFLGLANYYRRFILGYSDIAAPLTDLLKKNRAAIIKEPILALPDFTKLFEVQTDASDFAIGGILMQEGHPIAFESKKLNDAERRYTVHKREMTAIVHCLRTWRHYLLGAHFIVKTDNVATSYFQSQKKLSPKQARWQDFLAEFDYSLEYKPGKANVVADALTHTAVLAILLSTTSCGVLDTIKEGMEHDPVAK